MTDPEEFRIRRNHRDEWAKAEAMWHRRLRFRLAVVAVGIALALALVWIGGVR